MKLTRKMELYLINLGMTHLLESLIRPKKGIKKSAWTEARRRKFSDTMKKKWNKK
jgi:hypothetical protein